MTHPHEDHIKRQYVAQWTRLLKESIDTDIWGQTVEACESYMKLIQLVNIYIAEYSIYSTILNKLIYTVQLRVDQLNDIINTTTLYTNKQQIKLDQIKLLQNVIHDYFNNTNKQFPIELEDYTTNNDDQLFNNHSSTNNRHSKNVYNTNDIIHESVAHNTTNNTGWKTIQNGETYIKLYVYKIGFKDITLYNTPTCSVVLADRMNRIIESYDLSSSTDMKQQHIYFDQTIYIQSSLRDIQSQQLSLFIEFKHYKPSKSKQSTKCYSVMEYDEIMKSLNNKNTCLELYKKPVDYSLQKFALFTVKPLYLHCTVTSSQ